MTTTTFPENPFDVTPGEFARPLPAAPDVFVTIIDGLAR
jgi:hypothetical protein